MFWQPMIQRQGSIKALEFVSYALFKAYFHNIWRNHTGESLSEELVFAATNPQYDKRLFIELRVQYMKTKSAEHVLPMFCTCSFHVLNW